VAAKVSTATTCGRLVVSAGGRLVKTKNYGDFS
jgi:hypothetical protein